MLKINKTVTTSPEQMKIIIQGMRNAKNSWHLFDSKSEGGTFSLGLNDGDLAGRLSEAGTDHRKFMRMMVVYIEVVAPLYWWKEFDTYKIGTVANSCSTMHKIQAKEFEINDFSHEHLDNCGLNMMDTIIENLNANRRLFNDTKEKKYWWQMIQLLPSTYNQKRTVMLNYEVLRNIYHARKNHKLDEWHIFCEWIKTLPYNWLITGN